MKVGGEAIDLEHRHEVDEEHASGVIHIRPVVVFVLALFKLHPAALGVPDGENSTPSLELKVRLREPFCQRIQGRAAPLGGWAKTGRVA
jgi:hypothetical protein